jgi:hypothetical protein
MTQAIETHITTAGRTAARNKQLADALFDFESKICDLVHMAGIACSELELVGCSCNERTLVAVYHLENMIIQLKRDYYAQIARQREPSAVSI